MDKRYFSTVIVRGRNQLRRLREFEVDLFHSTVHASVASSAALFARASATPDQGALATDTFEIEGLLTLEQVGSLVDAGYSVYVEVEQRARSRADNIMGFEDWLKSLGEG